MRFLSSPAVKDMKKNKALKIVGIILLIAAVFAVWVYVEFFRFDPQVKSQVEQQYGKDFFRIESPKQNVEKEIQPEDSTSSIAKATQAKLKAEEQEQTDQSSVPRQEEIIDKYLPQFEALEGTATGRLQELYNGAVQEYKQQKAQGTLDLKVLVRKYLQASGMLETNIDSKFYSTLNEMKGELQRNNLPTDMVKTISQEYENAKTQKKRELMNRVKI